MTEHYTDDRVTVHHGDCLDILAAMPDNSVDAIVTDPPYGLGFMGKAWDDLPPGLPWAQQCLRVLKPGGHLLSFGGTRTWHRLMVAVEDAGFEIRDSIAWLYGSGFPKSLDVSKAIDKAAGAEREVIGSVPARMPQAQATGWGNPGVDAFRDARRGTVDMPLTAPATTAAQQWQGWGTALKPAFEPIVVARKPLAGTVAANVLTHGTGALNIDGCRVAHSSADDLAASQAKNPGRVDTFTSGVYGAGRPQQSVNIAGRWPTNVVLDGAAADGLGSESRYFPVFKYQAKAPARERVKVDGVAHPTVKPLELMRWLVRLVTPPGGTVLDPFAGSGTTVEAAILEGFSCVAIEREADYLPLIAARIARAA